MANINFRESLNRKNFSTLGILAAGYLVWRNRYRIQEFLESSGIRTPWMKENLSDAVRSGVAKVKGSAKQDIRGTANTGI